MLGERRRNQMTECKHGLRHGCFYCHNRTTTTTAITQPTPKRRTKATRLSEQMNDRMTNLKQRLRQIRGE
jgi:pyruvate-formate lyase-activating enzyme